MWQVVWCLLMFDTSVLGELSEKAKAPYQVRFVQEQRNRRDRVASQISFGAHSSTTEPIKRAGSNMLASVLALTAAAATSSWIEPHRYLFLYHVRPAATFRTQPPSWWCPGLRHSTTQRFSLWWSQHRQRQSELTTSLLRALDPSTRFPKPEPPPLSLLAKSVGKEQLIENKGRKAKIKKTRRGFIRPQPQQLDAWSALDDGLF